MSHSGKRPTFRGDTIRRVLSTTVTPREANTPANGTPVYTPRAVTPRSRDGSIEILDINGNTNGNTVSPRSTDERTIRFGFPDTDKMNTLIGANSNESMVNMSSSHGKSPKFRPHEQRVDFNIGSVLAANSMNNGENRVMYNPYNVPLSGSGAGSGHYGGRMIPPPTVPRHILATQSISSAHTFDSNGGMNNTTMSFEGTDFTNNMYDDRNDHDTDGSSKSNKSRSAFSHKTDRTDKTDEITIDGQTDDEDDEDDEDDDDDKKESNDKVGQLGIGNKRVKKQKSGGGLSGQIVHTVKHSKMKLSHLLDLISFNMNPSSLQNSNNNSNSKNDKKNNNNNKNGKVETVVSGTAGHTVIEPAYDIEDGARYDRVGSVWSRDRAHTDVQSQSNRNREHSRSNTETMI